MPNNLFDTFLETFMVQRSEFISKLVSFVPQDTLLFLPDCKEVCEKIEDANCLLKTDFVICNGIMVAEQNLNQQQKVTDYLNKLSLEKSALIYLVATEVRSVLSAVLFAEKKLSVTGVFNLAFREELEQQKVWGTTDDIIQRQQEIKNKLDYLEKIRDERSLS